MNKIRRQLGKDYGKRVDFRVFNVKGDPDNIYFPFSKKAFRKLKKGQAPTKGFIVIPR